MCEKGLKMFLLRFFVVSRLTKKDVYHIERNALCIFFYCMRRLFGFDKIRLRVGKQRKKTIMSMEEKLEAELRVAPQDHAKWVQLGQAYFDTDFRKAHACFSRALALEPFNAQDRLNRGRKSLSMDAFEEALADFSLAVRLDPQDGFKWHYLGNACFFLERFDAAIACYMEAMKCHRKNGVALEPPAIDWIWMSYMRSGKPDEAQVFVREHTNPDIPVEDSDLSYKKRILLYAGYTPVETYIKEVVNYDDELDAITELYGVVNYYKYIQPDACRAARYVADILKYPGYHHSFAYKLAFMDQEAMKEGDKK